MFKCFFVETLQSCNDTNKNLRIICLFPELDLSIYTKRSNSNSEPSSSGVAKTVQMQSAPATFSFSFSTQASIQACNGTQIAKESLQTGAVVHFCCLADCSNSHCKRRGQVGSQMAELHILSQKLAEDFFHVGLHSP